MKKIKRVCLNFVSACLVNVIFIQSTLAEKPGQGLLYTVNSEQSANLSQEEERQGEEKNLEKQSPVKDITLYINSQGGSVTDGMAVYDVLRHVKGDVPNVCIGVAASLGAFLLAAGTKGKRFALQNSMIMIHKLNSPIAPFAALSSPIIASVTSLLITIFADNTGKTYEEVDKDTAVDYFLTASEDKEYGVIDEVLLN